MSDKLANFIKFYNKIFEYRRLHNVNPHMTQYYNDLIIPYNKIKTKICYILRQNYNKNKYEIMYLYNVIINDSYDYDLSTKQFIDDTLNKYYNVCSPEIQASINKYLCFINDDKILKTITNDRFLNCVYLCKYFVNFFTNWITDDANCIYKQHYKIYNEIIKHNNDLCFKEYKEYKETKEYTTCTPDFVKLLQDSTIDDTVIQQLFNFIKNYNHLYQPHSQQNNLLDSQ